MLFSSPRQRRWLAVAGLALGCVAVRYVWLLVHAPPHILRVGYRNDSLTASQNPGGRVDSLAVEVVANAARRSGVPLRWVDCPEGPDAALKSGKIDLWPAMQIDPGRERVVHLTDPWLAGERCLVSKGPLPSDWHHLKAAYGLGPINQLLTAAPGVTAIHTQGDVAAIDAVCQGDAVAAYVLVQSLGSFILKRPPGCEEDTDFRITPLSGKLLKLGIGSTFAAASAADRLRSEVSHMAAQGDLQPLFDKYALYSVAETANIYELMDAERRSKLFGWGTAGLVGGFAILLWQVRSIRQARRYAEYASRAKSDFLANMSHEVRTPLNGIVAMTELLAASPLTPNQREMVDVVLSSSESLMSIVNDVLDFSKIEAGHLQLEQTPFDLRKAAEDCVKLFLPKAAARNLTLTCFADPSLPAEIVGDPLRMRQVILNLLSNAIKFTETGGVRIELLRAGDPAGPAVLVRVIDTGIGVPPEVAQKLFRAFTQADSATTRRFGGTGLGLAISLRLVTLMGGSIGLESPPGGGTTFWFLAPAQAAPPRTEPDASLQASGVEPLPTHTGAVVSPSLRRVLVVEDNPVNQLVVSRMLQSLGYLPSLVSGGEAALAALSEEAYDLVFMDCQMPGMDGYETAAEIRLREGDTRRVPIVAMTANTVLGDRERCLAAGMDDYLAKPLRLAPLEAMLERWLRGACPHFGLKKALQ